jgi:PPOX class probable F420-dependent enzyme
MNAEQEQFINEGNVAVLTTVDAKGRPHGIPIWYVYEDGIFIMSTGAGSQKHRNIERNPNVTLVIDKRRLPYYALMAQGQAELGPALPEELRRRIAARYLTERQLEAYLSRRREGDSVSIRLRPRKLIEYHGAAGRE